MYVIFTQILNYAFVLLLFLFIAYIARDLGKGLNATEAKKSEHGLSLVITPLDNPHKKHLFHMTKKNVSIGRSPNCDIVLEDPYVSTIHARLIYENNTLILEDIDSANGTLLNDKRIQGAVAITLMDRVRIGRIEISFRKD